MPNLERMARGGIRFTDFYAASAACSPSRAALLTGRYPPHVDVPGVIMPQSQRGIPQETLTLAEMLRDAGYSTACYGKWHLGHLEPFLPAHHGFDEYFGIPYSQRHDAGFNEEPKPLRKASSAATPGGGHDHGRHGARPALPHCSGTRSGRWLSLRKTVTNPFFLYLPYAAPHMPLFVTEPFDGASGRGLYSDVLLEIDWSVGQILDALEAAGLESSTMVFFTSDNGPWLVKGEGSGVARPLREGKGTTFEGGHRVPFLAYWPGVIPAGRRQSGNGHRDGPHAHHCRLRSGGNRSGSLGRVRYLCRFCAARRGQLRRTKRSSLCRDGGFRRCAAGSGNCMSRTGIGASTAPSYLHPCTPAPMFRTRLGSPCLT